MTSINNTSEKSDKLALITGATRGIGRAIALRLIQDGHNCIITGTSTNRPDNVPPGIDYYGVDLSNRTGVAQLAEAIVEWAPAILINNAGINVKGDTPTFRLSEFDRMLDINLRGPFTLIQSVLPSMISAGWGRIVNITSLWGLTGNPMDAAYCASKYGLDGLTTSVAAEVARQGILINAVAPGFIYTEAAQAAFSSDDLAAVSTQIPLGRLGRPEEVAALVSWLVSEENTYMTGQNLLIDGGLTRTART
jgi:NAD(P)-dependent dehydrogenase (short-subunit alcohol dehydrogenase family)